MPVLNVYGDVRNTVIQNYMEERIKYGVVKPRSSETQCFVRKL